MGLRGLLMQTAAVIGADWVDDVLVYCGPHFHQSSRISYTFAANITKFCTNA